MHEKMTMSESGKLGYQASKQGLELARQKRTILLIALTERRTRCIIQM